MNGKLTISRWTSNVEPYSGIRIEVTDQLSGITFMCADIKQADFADALTGLSFVPCGFELRFVENVGKRVETKDVKIEVTKHPSNYSDEEALKIIAEYEVDGWTSRGLYVWKNSHNWKGKVLSLSLFRYVGAEK